jgi:LPS-assembly lipoprotein
MWWYDRLIRTAPFLRIGLALSLAALTSACFQPLYSEQTVAGRPGLVEALRGVDVAQIAAPSGTSEARMAVEIRNALLFDLTGGGAGSQPTHRLTVHMATTRSSVIVDVNTIRPDIENYGINVRYSLMDLRTRQEVFAGNTFSRVSYDIPGQQQRFARARGLRDAENRAGKVIAENIRTRLAAYFASGG